MPNLKSLNTIFAPGRISSIDIFRGAAILSVVIYHFNAQTFSFGNLGVDLFFVISGLLIGGILIKQLTHDQPINFAKFFLQRGFKIWPSYYAFLLFGNLLAYVLYENIAPGQIIPLWDLKRYLFFYQNYKGAPFHLSFDQVWSLCVEEHFYILLPVLLILIQKFVSPAYRQKTLLTSIILTITAGVALKFCSFYFTHSKDTYSGTHNRLDGLAWGVLLAYLLNFNQKILTIKKVKIMSFVIGLAVFLAAIFFHLHSKGIFFDKVILHSMVPFAFFLMLAGAYFVDFTRIKSLRIIACYSYNWYLWHPVFVIIVKKYCGTSIAGLAVYILISFLTAFVFTVMVEEPALQARAKVLSMLFKRTERRLVNA
jgi:peptidoglycan/LPS O-acetylase OafA/YrhL